MLNAQGELMLSTLEVGILAGACIPSTSTSQFNRTVSLRTLASGTRVPLGKNAG